MPPLPDIADTGDTGVGQDRVVLGDGDSRLSHTARRPPAVDGVVVAAGLTSSTDGDSLRIIAIGTSNTSSERSNADDACAGS
jgi:hypothetical protein